MPKKTKNSKLGNPSACVFCKSSEDDEHQFGKFFHSELSVHNFCLLFSSGLSQNGKNDDDGFAGFLAKDIKKEVDRGRRLKCSYCKSNGATIGCCKPTCKKVFHLNCGLKHNSLHLFFGSFPSYCSAHKAKPTYPDELPTKELFCAICYNVVSLKNYDTTVWTSCCKNGWFHKPCIQRQATSAGYFFRCPLCNNSEQFQKQMLAHGIYIPQQDAAWELEDNAFQELLVRHGQCDAACCLCPKGRKHNTKKTSQWHLVLCEDCGSQGRHVGCDSSVSSKYSWKCEACTEISQKLKSKKKKNEYVDKKMEKGKTTNNSEPHEQLRATRALRRATVKVEPIEVPTTRDQISSILGEKHVPDKTSVALHNNTQPPQKNHSPYKIIRITKSEPIAQTESSSACQENEMCEVSERALVPYNQVLGSRNGGQTDVEQNLPKITRNLSLDDMHCETSMCIDDDFQVVKKPDLKVSDMNDLLPNVIAGKSLNFSQQKPEHFFDDDRKEFELPSNSSRNSMIDDYKEALSLSVSNNSSHFLHDGKNVIDLPSDVCDIVFGKNETHNPNHKRKGLNGICFTEAKNCEKNKSTADNSVITHCVDDKTLASMKNAGSGSLEEEDTLQYPLSPCDTLKSSKSHGRHPKRIYSDMEDKFIKKQKGNGAVIILSLNSGTGEIIREIKENHHKAHKNAVHLESKTVNKISLPTSSSSILPHDGQNSIGQKKAPIIMNVCSSSEHSHERDHREPLMKLGSSNGLVQSVVKSECSSNNCELYNNSGKCGKSDTESENRAVKKQKSNAVMPKRHYTSHPKYRNHYLCIKALFGKPCICCEDRPKLSKQSSGKGNHHKKCGPEGCKCKYAIDCYKSGSSFNRLGEKSLVNKRSTNCHSKYVVDIIRSGPSVPEMVSENKVKSSVKHSGKPQVIHLKTAGH